MSSRVGRIVCCIALAAMLSGTQSLLAPSARAQADDVCTISGDVTFAGGFVPSVGGANVSCTGGVGTPSSDDDWRCDGPHTVTIAGDWVQANEWVGLRLTGSCSLRAEVDDVSPVAFTIALGQKGLNTKLNGEGGPARNSNGTLVSSGKYLSHHQSPPVVYDLPNDEPPNPNGSPYFHLGDIVPCVDGDCSTDADRVQILYPAGRWGISSSGTQPEDMVFGDSLEAFVGTTDLAPGEEEEADVVCIWDLIPDDDHWAPEAGFCYTVVDADGLSEPRSLTLSVLQGGWDTAKRGHAWRDYQPITLTNAVVAGQHAFDVDETLPDPHADPDPSRTDPFMGRRVRCQTGVAGEWESHSYLIAHHDASTIRLVAPHEGGSGFLHDYPAGRACVIGYGFQSGDPFYGYRPVVWTATQPTPAADELYRGTIRLRGMDTTLTASVLTQLQHGIQVIHESHAWTDVWLRDPWGGHAVASMRLFDVTSASLTRTTTTGGAPNGAPSRDENDPSALLCFAYDGTPSACVCDREDRDGNVSTVDDQHNPDADCHLHRGLMPSGGRNVSVTSYTTRHVAADNVAPSYYQSADYEFGTAVFR